MSGILASMGGGALPDLVINVTGQVNPNMNALASAWLGPAQKVRIVNTGNVNTLVIPADFVPGSEVTLENAAGGLIGGTASGGHALTVRRAVRVQNLGTLAGGGGAGGAGGSAWVGRTVSGNFQYASGSGGAGGNGQGFAPGSVSIINRANGAPGTTGTLGASGTFGGGTGRGEAVAYGGQGGTGGMWGEVGYLGGVGGVSGDYDSSGASPGAAGSPAGYYIDGNAHVTWINTGTRLGAAKA